MCRYGKTTVEESLMQRVVLGAFAIPVHRGTLMYARRGGRTAHSPNLWGPVGGRVEILPHRPTQHEYKALSKALQPATRQNPRLLKEIIQANDKGQEHSTQTLVREFAEELFNDEDPAQVLLEGRISDIAYLGTVCDKDSSTPSKAFRNALYVASVQGDMTLKQDKLIDIQPATEVGWEETFKMGRLAMYELRHRIRLSQGNDRDPFSNYQALELAKVDPSLLPVWLIIESMTGLQEHYMRAEQTPQPESALRNTRNDS